ncbi:Bug family tripartite tricarboxylate transporter substrate binding protein [Falsiroseomonas oryzae]|uniref:Bug family tripartite tricarboxylate transporter substrate binding protein n=1 Tax=Falsiroseomonas oryzae TaxID=2766473 RepID=UPI0022EA8481|nr:tripartite tricarboxylate transporter substrate binding protein [Roseomonas sp. MO-31]
MTAWGRRGALLLSAAALAAPGLARGQAGRPLRFVVPYAPGGQADNHTRLIAQHLRTVLGRDIVVDNRPGGSAVIGTDHVVRSTPDGTTVLFVAKTVLFHEMLVAQPTFRMAQLAPVIVIGEFPSLWTVSAQTGLADWAAFVARAKERPGQLSYATLGRGSLTHLNGELLEATAGIDLVDVPYRGAAPAMLDLLAGRVDAYFDTPTWVAADAYVSGGVRALAITSAQRSPMAPNVPTFAELGLPGLTQTAWNGYMVPAATPPEVVQQLNAALQQVLAMPEVAERLGRDGLSGLGGGTDRFAALLRQESEVWSGLIRRLGLRID